MPQISKRKAHLHRISDLRNEGKRRKFDKDTETKSAFLAQQIRDKDLWDEYKSFNSESSSDEFSSDHFSTDESESEEKSCLKNLELDKEIKEKPQQMMNLKWTTGAGAYLRGTRGCGSASTNKRLKRHRQELEAEVSKCKSIPEMFNMQRQIIPVKQPKTKTEIRIQSSLDLEDLLQHKTKQIASKFSIKM